MILVTNSTHISDCLQMTVFYMELLVTSRTLSASRRSQQTGGLVGKMADDLQCQQMIFTKSHLCARLCCQLHLHHDGPTHNISHTAYLGVDLDNKLTWNGHISAITGKANRSLGFIRRNLYNCPEKIKTQAYFSLVRPQLEYASSVWDPHTQKNIKALENIQRRAARFVKNCKERANPGDNDKTVERARMANTWTKEKGSEIN